MLSFMSDRRVLAVSAACITAAIFLFLLGTYPSWKAAIGGGLSWRNEAPAVPDVPPPAPSGKTSEAQPSSPGSQTPAPIAQVQTRPQPASTPIAPSSPAASPAPPAAADSGAPSFDIVRVEPSGDSVIAARATAGAKVSLLDQGKVIAEAQADGSGQVAFVPPALAPGEHSLMLSVGKPDQPGGLSSQSVAVSVPQQAKAAPMVALLQPDQPTRLLTSPSATGAPGVVSTPAPPVSVGAIDVEEMGSVFATGHAAPGSQCRVYLNGSFVANVLAGKDGAWSLKIQHGMKPGHYSVRVDQLASAAGDVQARAEVPFDYPAGATSSVSLLRPRKGTAAPPVTQLSQGGATQQAASGSGKAVVEASSGPAMAITDAVAKARPAADQSPVAAATIGDAPATLLAPEAGVPTVVAQLLTTKVVHGDSLWRISRKILGHGRRYTQIYAANTTQIRNPRLIYPGQIFVMPQQAP